ncbi:MAG TPA: hypothetical protein VEW93_15515 [Acidimicrobiales bacterium]|nr:hypothetical protein [Acidimicrobiales bacterium]
MAVDEEHLLRVLVEFRDDLARHRLRLAGQVDGMERAYSMLGEAVAGRAADELLQRSRRSREAFGAYDEAVRAITLVLSDRIAALQGA